MFNRVNIKIIIVLVCFVLVSGVAFAGGGGYNWASFGGISSYTDNYKSNFVAPVTISCFQQTHGDLCVICKVNNGTVHCAKFDPNSLPNK